METSHFSKLCLTQRYIPGSCRMPTMGVAIKEEILHSRRLRTHTGGLICIIQSPSTVKPVMNARCVPHIGIQSPFSCNMFVPCSGSLMLTQSTCLRLRRGFKYLVDLINNLTGWVAKAI